MTKANLRDSVRAVIGQKDPVLAADLERLDVLCREYRPMTAIDVGTRDGTLAKWLSGRVPRVLTLDTVRRVDPEELASERIHQIVAIPNDPSTVRLVGELVLRPALLCLAPSGAARTTEHLEAFSQFAEWIMVQGALYSIIPGIAPDNLDYHRDGGPALGVDRWHSRDFEEWSLLTNHSEVSGCLWMRRASLR